MMVVIAGSFSVCDVVVFDGALCSTVGGYRAITSKSTGRPMAVV